VYKLEVSPAAERDLAKYKNRISRHDFEGIKEAVRNLAKIPRPKGARKITGTDKAYRIRVGDWRVIYEVYDKDSIVLILRINRRNETTYK
jgi:mRNA interferase RelE/StbE